MSEAEGIPSFVESQQEPTTVLDAYDAVVSLGEARVTQLALQIWDTLSPETQQDIKMTAYATYPGVASSSRYICQLIIFNYVNRAPGEPRDSTQETAI